MLKIKDDVDLKELEKFGFRIIPEGIYAKSTYSYVNGLGDLTEYFITVETDRTLKKFKVCSYLKIVFSQIECHLFKWSVRDLIKASLVEDIKELRV
ncbi:MAG: hypothetical protein J6B87_02970 [Clostridia bacterium]|nr:hypothetical protein [Clostridia bacterium]